MRRILLAAAVGAAIGAGGLALAQHGYRGPETVRTLSERDIVEKLDGKEARVTMQEVTFEPGQAGLPHRHAGPMFGYVLEGEFEFGHRRRAREDAQGRGDVLRAERGPAPGGPQPERQDQDPGAGRDPAPPRREGDHDPGRRSNRSEPMRSLRRRGERGDRPPAPRRVGPPRSRRHGHDATPTPGRGTSRSLGAAVARVSAFDAAGRGAGPAGVTGGSRHRRVDGVAPAPVRNGRRRSRATGSCASKAAGTSTAPRGRAGCGGTSSSPAASSSNRAAGWPTSPRAWRSTPARAWRRARGPTPSWSRGC